MMHTLTFTPEQLGVVDEALGAMPYRAAAPVIAAINEQLAEAARAAAADLDAQRNRNRDTSSAAAPRERETA